jgi:hypothetical protein
MRSIPLSKSDATTHGLEKAKQYLPKSGPEGMDNQEKWRSVIQPGVI